MPDIAASTRSSSAAAKPEDFEVGLQEFSGKGDPLEMGPYIRIFQNGDGAGFNWNYGGRLYGQPPATNYQQMSKKARLKMTFNGEALAELDIRASYLTLF